MIVLYDDNGNLVTNKATLRALEESERIIADWKKRHEKWSYDDDDDEE